MKLQLEVIESGSVRRGTVTLRTDFGLGVWFFLLAV